MGLTMIKAYFGNRNKSNVIQKPDSIKSTVTSGSCQIKFK